jgi:predicted MFS family arabinose efflux permease
MYIRGFVATILLATGGFMMMPFSSAFLVNNIGIAEGNLSTIFFVTGIFSMFTGPLIGKLSDKLGKYRLFVSGTILSILMVLIYTHLGPSSIWLVIAINTIMWIGISSRIISSSALTSGIPTLKDRGAYMGISSSVQQLSGGAAAFIAGLIVHQETKTSPLQNFDIVGYVVIGTMLFTIVMMKVIDRQVSKKLHVEHA